MVRPVTIAAAARWMPRRKKGFHKGDCGRIYAVAGSRGLAGAAALVGWGAMRSGAGLVKVATVSGQQILVARKGPMEITTQALPENRTGQVAVSALPLLRKTIGDFRPDVIAVGPGLGTSPSVRSIVLALVQRSLVPMVLDADGLNVFAGNPRALALHKNLLVITPHVGELSRLLSAPPARIQANRLFFAELAARKFHCVCLLNGAGTIITDGRSSWRNTTGNSGMASGGMGDVLTGVIAGVWGQRLRQGKPDPLAAAALGAFVHGAAGDLASKTRGPHGLLASDVAEHLPQTIKKICNRMDS